MKSLRLLAVVVILLVLAACGRVLPDDITPAVQTGTETTSQVTPLPEEADQTADSEDAPAAAAASDEIVQRVELADPSRGETLYNQMTDTGFACSNCHLLTDGRLVGPGLLGIAQQAAYRVEGQVAERYLYNSILHPNDYIVADYPPDVMPRTYEEIFSEGETLDLVAYLMTLRDPNFVPPADVAASPDQSAADGDGETTASGESENGDAQTDEVSTGSEVASQVTPEVIVITAPPQIIVVTATPAPDQDETEAVASPEEDVDVELIQATPEVEPTAQAIVELSGLGWGVPVIGQGLFDQVAVDDFTCADCHLTDSAETLVGPGLAGLVTRSGGTEAAGPVIYSLIVDPAVHAELSQNYSDILSDSQVYDLVAYLVTLPEADATVIADGEDGAVEDSIIRLVSVADPANGETLFNQMTDTGFACLTCHYVDSQERLIGPGFLGLPEQAATRVEGQVAERYLYNSILHPNEYIVEDYPPDVMPKTYEEIFSTREIYDIVAYLMTLHE